MRVLTLLFFTSLSLSLLAQTTISGTVKNENGEALSFASVFLVQTDYGSVTDASGNFTLNTIPDGDYLLKVSFVGYKSLTQEITLDGRNQFLDLVLEGALYDLDEIEIAANRVDETGGFTYENVDKEELERINLGQDIPILLSTATNVVSNSDAGAGIGYTDMRIRGSDGTRVNVTINGVPWNDSESHGVFFVNLPNLSGDAQSIQIQRGVGTSTNGAGAFGGTVSINTHSTSIKPYASVTGGLGSFGTQKLNVNLGTGLINDSYTVDASFSNIQSDGYIDRASSDLRSYSLSLAKLSKNRSLRLDIISGAERTYQSWYGAPESLVKGDQAALEAHYQRNIGSLYVTAADSINLFSSDRRYNYYLYEDQVDDYGQDHYQFHWSEILSEKVKMNTTLFYTRGKGFFEQYRFQDDLDFYGLTELVNNSGNPIDVGNVVRRRWLDNDFFGTLLDFSIDAGPRTHIIIGGAASRYLGGHFGEAVRVENTPRFNPLRYYEGDGNKTDANIYIKADHYLTEDLSVFGDVQYRNIVYTVDGTDNDLQVFDLSETFHFFNPKFGFNLQLGTGSNLYGSYARANREPVRNDFTDNPVDATPEAETLDNVELGIRMNKEEYAFTANVYYMKYTNQLIPTGVLNDVGAALRQNVEDSHRAGIELSGAYQVNKMWTLSANAAFSRNKIEEFTEIVYDYTNGFDVVTIDHGTTDIALSPNVVANVQLECRPMEGLYLALAGQHVGEQFLDNTSNEARKIDGYLVSNFNASYDWSFKGVKNVRINAMVNNLFDTMYANKGYTYSYIFGETITENYLYPQAGINFLMGVTFDF